MNCSRIDPSSNIHGALRWIALCCSLRYPEEMKMDGDALKPLRQLQLDLNTSVYSEKLNCSIFLLSACVYKVNGFNGLLFGVIIILGIKQMLVAHNSVKKWK
jgi:hypothetical protein